MDTLKDIESSVLEQLKSKFTPTIYDLWFKSLQLVSLDGDAAVFSTDSNFKQDLIEKRHAGAIKDALKEVVGFEVRIVIESREGRDGFHIPEIEDRPEPTRKKPVLPDDPEPEKINPEEAIESSSIVDEYTFENFIEGESNRFALAACRALLFRDFRMAGQVGPPGGLGDGAKAALDNAGPPPSQPRWIPHLGL